MASNTMAATDGLFDLTGQVAAMTGAARGLGLAIVQAFATHGASVVLADRNSAVAECEADRPTAANADPDWPDLP